MIKNFFQVVAANGGAPGGSGVEIANFAMPCFGDEVLSLNPYTSPIRKTSRNCMKFIRKTYEKRKNYYVGYSHKDRQVWKKFEFRINEISTVCLGVSLCVCVMVSLRDGNGSLKV